MKFRPEQCKSDVKLSYWSSSPEFLLLLLGVLLHNQLSSGDEYTRFLQLLSAAAVEPVVDGVSVGRTSCLLNLGHLIIAGVSLTADPLVFGLARR